jgi:hypothetical protein
MPLHLSPRSFDIDKWECRTVLTLIERERLDASPLYQRNQVWTTRNKVKLVQSIILAYPMGAITVLEKRDEFGDASFDVIDGKQRISTIDEFARLRTLVLSNADLKPLSDYRPLTDLVKAAAFNAKPDGPFGWDDFSDVFHNRFNAYAIGVVRLLGSIEDAREAFTRMNRTVYKLEPQEIRNAAFSGYPVLRACKRLADDSWPGFSDKPLVAWGVISAGGLRRMKDVQMYGELLHLLQDGPQHRRDGLDRFFASFRPQDQGADDAVQSLETRLRRVVGQIAKVLGTGDLQQHGFRRHGEDDLYALVEAFAAANLSAPQLDQSSEEVRSALASFRGLVDDLIEILRGKQQIPEDLEDPNLRAYAGSFLGGQINSKKRRKERAATLQAIITTACGQRDEKRQFSDYERRKIWRNSPDKMCARGDGVVVWKEYHAGHKEGHALTGPTLVENGQVEHQRCNQAAGAT